MSTRNLIIFSTCLLTISFTATAVPLLQGGNEASTRVCVFFPKVKSMYVVMFLTKFLVSFLISRCSNTLLTFETVHVLSFQERIKIPNKWMERMGYGPLKHQKAVDLRLQKSTPPYAHLSRVHVPDQSSLRLSLLTYMSIISFPKKFTSKLHINIFVHIESHQHQHIII